MLEYRKQGVRYEATVFRNIETHCNFSSNSPSNLGVRGTSYVATINAMGPDIYIFNRAPHYMGHIGWVSDEQIQGASSTSIILAGWIIYWYWNRCRNW